MLGWPLGTGCATRPRPVRTAPSTRKSDHEGRFRFGGLWGGDLCQITITAADRFAFGSAQITATSGGVHDFGKIVLAASNGRVEGKAIDSTGKPLADVRVFNSSDGVAPMETQTNSEGVFRLDGFRKGPVFVFAEKDGYRFVALHSTTGTKDAVVKMLRTAEPAVPLPCMEPSREPL